MRFVSRLHLCAAASIFMVLYFTWLHQSTTFRSNVAVFRKASKHRVVVFGNDWSDIGSYRVSGTSRSAVTPRDIDRGEIWVETLCEELGCDSVDNFARSYLFDPETSSFGAVVDALLHARTKYGENVISNATTFDFTTQALQFMLYDKTEPNFIERMRKTDQKTTFTVFFGLWDILEYATLEYGPASRAVEQSIAKLFATLDVLSVNATRPVQVVIPRMIDLTFLPWVQSVKYDTQEHFAERQHQLVFLAKYWNTVLLRTAKEWKNGEVYMPDPNAMIMEQVRIAQLYAREISDASGIGKQAPLFEEVEQPCLALDQSANATSLQAVIEKCGDPSRYLFWDDIRLSGRAHHLIGKEAASLVREHQIVNVGVMQGTANDPDSEDKEATNFNLKYPPGY